MEYNDLKKVRTYFNKLIASTKRSSTKLKLECSNGNLVHTLQMGMLGIKVGLSTNNPMFSPKLISYGDWYDWLNTKVDDVVITSTNDTLYFNQDEILSENTISGNAKWNGMFKVSGDMLNNGFSINSVCAKNGKYDCNSYMFFQLKDNELSILNSNDIILQKSTMEADGFDIKFSISNEYIAMLKKWINQSTVSVDDIIVSVNDARTFMKMDYEMDDLSFEIIFPIQTGNYCDKVITTFNNIISRTYSKKSITLNMDKMLEDSVEENYNNLMMSEKKSDVDKKNIQKEYDAFKTSKTKSLRGMKSFDIPYLKISSIVNMDNVYIHRTLLQDFLKETSQFSLDYYNLETKTIGLYIEGLDDGEMVKSQTLFMLRKPITIQETEEMEEETEE